MKSDVLKASPQSCEAEQAVLGSILIDNKSLYEIALRQEHFYSTIHGKIFKAMLELSNSDIPIDLITLEEILKKQNVLKQIGGVYYLTQLAESIPSSANICYHARLILEKYNLRKAQESCYKLQAMIDEGLEANEIYDAMGSFAIENIGDNREYELQEVLHQTYKEIDKRIAGQIQSMSSGIPGLDAMMNFEYGDLVMFGGYTSSGKTSLAVQVALNVLYFKRRVLFFELEMTRQRLATRLLSMHGQFNSGMFWAGQLSAQDLQKATKAFNDVQQLPLTIDDTSGVSLEYVRARAKRSKQKHDLQMVVIDYLQLMDMGKEESREQAISMVTKKLKSMAKELNIVVILISQFHRHEGSRYNKRPTMYDFKGSGAIEQDADKVILVWQPNLKKSDEELGLESRNKAVLILEKNREGAVGDIELVFNRNYTKFE